MRLLDTRLGDGWGSSLVLDGARLAANSLDRLDDAHGGSVTLGDLAEDDVTAIEPRSHDSGDKELRAIARMC